MPYRRAHWALLALFPLILVSFWKNYFGQLGAAPFALHAHGATATLWLALVAWQNWSARQARLPAHRSVGLLLFLVAPLFAAGGMLAVQGGIALGVADTDPFHATYSIPLAFDDMMAVLAFAGLVAYGLANRRRTAPHAAAMLATVWLVLPPILARTLQLVPGFPNGFLPAFYVGQGIGMVGALWVARLERRGAPVFLFVAAVLAVQIATFENFAMSALWERAALALLAVPPTAVAVTTLALTAAALWLAWRSVPPRAPRRAATAA